MRHEWGSAESGDQTHAHERLRGVLEYWSAGSICSVADTGGQPVGWLLFLCPSPLSSPPRGEEAKSPKPHLVAGAHSMSGETIGSQPAEGLGGGAPAPSPFWGVGRGEGAASAPTLQHSIRPEYLRGCSFRMAPPPMLGAVPRPWKRLRESTVWVVFISPPCCGRRRGAARKVCSGVRPRRGVRGKHFSFLRGRRRGRKAAAGAPRA